MPGVKLLVRIGEDAVGRSPSEPKIPVKVDQDVARIAGILAAAEGMNLAEWLSRFLREALREPYEEFLARERAQGQDTPTETESTAPQRRKPSGK